MKTTFKKSLVALFIGLFTAGWISPLITSFKQLCSWLYFSHQSNGPDSGVVLDIATGFFNISMMWLGIVIFSWSAFAVYKSIK
jgi:hypothetical protein